MKMINFNFITFVLVFTRTAVTSVDNVTPTNQLEGQILSLLEKWREGELQTSVIPLPSLKTINIHQIDSSYDEGGIKFSFSIEDMKLIGLDTFSVESLNVMQNLDNIQVSAKLAVPVLTLYSENYKLKGHAYLFYPLQGSGKMTIFIRNIEVSMNIRFANFESVRTKTDDLKLEFNIDKVDANLENSAWPINQVLNRDGVDIIKSYHKVIVDAASYYVVPYVNDYLANTNFEGSTKQVSGVSAKSYVIEKNRK